MARYRKKPVTIEAVVALCDEVLRLRASSPSRESGALLESVAMLRGFVEGVCGHNAGSEVRKDAPLYRALCAVESRLSTLERDAARMREAIGYATAALQALASATRQHHEPETEAAFRREDARAALYALRAALTPSGEPTTTPETSE